MKKPISACIVLWVMLSACIARAEITPVFGANDEIYFGAMLFIQGNCTMSHVDGSFSNINPAMMCGASGKGTPGHYSIVAEPNRMVSIKIIQRDNQGDGLLFVPTGELISDVETLAITPGTDQEINSGVSGVVDIRVGGSLYVLSPLSPGVDYQLEVSKGIEWSVLP